MVTRRSWPLLLGLACGCGLSDYESRVAEQQARIARFDEREKYLGAPLDMPRRVNEKKESVSILPFDVFVRPSKEIARTIKDFEEFNQLVLLRYSGTAGFNMFLAGSLVGEKDKKGRFKDGELSPEEFRHRVRGALTAFYRATYKRDITFPPATSAEKETVQPDPDPVPARPLEFDVLSFPDRTDVKDPTQFALYFHRSGIQQAAVVYQFPKSHQGEMARPMGHSLKSLAIGDDAKKARERK